MESWLPWLADDDEVLFDRLGADAQVVVLDPRRCRDRAADILAEEADLAESLSRTWGIGDHAEFPPLHLPFDRLLAMTDAPLVSFTGVPEGPTVPVIEASGWDPGSGRAADPAASVRQFLDDGWTVVVAADGAGTRRSSGPSLRRARPRARRASTPTIPRCWRPGRASRWRPSSAVSSSPSCRSRSSPRASSPVAVVSHRRQRARRRDAQSFFDDLRTGVVRGARPARRRPVRRHRQAGHRRHRARLPAARVPRRRQALRARATRSTPCATTPVATRRRSAGWAAPTGTRPRPRCDPPSRRSPRSWWCSTRSASPPRVMPSPRHAVAGRGRERLPVPGDARPAGGHRRRQRGHGTLHADGSPGVRRRRLRQDRGGAAGGVQGHPGRLPGRGAGAHHPAGPAALPDLQRTVRALPHPGRGA